MMNEKEKVMLILKECPTLKALYTLDSERASIAQYLIDRGVVVIQCEKIKGVLRENEN